MTDLASARHIISLNGQNREREDRSKGWRCLLWQFNTPWPATEWAILDFYRRPKLAYAMVQRLFSPTTSAFTIPAVPVWGNGYTPG